MTDPDDRIRFSATQYLMDEMIKYGMDISDWRVSPMLDVGVKTYGADYGFKYTRASPAQDAVDDIGRNRHERRKSAAKRRNT